MKNRLIWIAMLATIAVLFLRFGEGLITNKGVLTVTTDNVPADAVLFEWSGEVAPPMLDLLRKAYRQWGPKKSRIIVSLHSPGGHLRHGDRVVRLMQDMARTHQLDTVVERRKTCASMCVPIYLQGENRLAHPSSRWLFHEPRAFDIVTDETTPTTARETEQMTQEFLQRYFSGSEVSRTWVAKTREKMRGRDYWRSGQQLIDERSGIVQRLL